jgi:hypothetical protein
MKKYEYENLLDKQDYLCIDDFIHISYKGAIINADKCEVFKNTGIILYKDNKVIMSLEEDVIFVKNITVGLKMEHYYIQSKNSHVHQSDMYLIKYEKARNNLFKLDDLVARVDDETAMKLSFYYNKHEESFNCEEQMIKENYLWKIIDIKENLFAKIKKGNDETYISLKNIATIQHIKDTSLKHIEKGLSI